jgi:hypothetical protein
MQTSRKDVSKKSQHKNNKDTDYDMLTRSIYSSYGIMYEVLSEVFHLVIQFTKYVSIYSHISA